MPIYEYQCQACEHEFEALQKMSDDKLTDCPACHKPELKKLISAAGFRLKGSGWYESDFKKTSSPPKKAADKPADKPAASCCSGGACGGG